MTFLPIEAGVYNGPSYPPANPGIAKQGAFCAADASADGACGDAWIGAVAGWQRDAAMGRVQIPRKRFRFKWVDTNETAEIN